MIVEPLLQYGVLGLWTVFNVSTILYYRKKEDRREAQLGEIIKNNTIAITRVYEVIRACPKN